jgi:hypothetical protein
LVVQVESEARNMSSTELAVARPELVEEWKKAYAQFCADHGSDDWDFRSLCIGWCVAKGLTTEQGYDFYQKMIPLELF